MKHLPGNFKFLLVASALLVSACFSDKDGTVHPSPSRPVLPLRVVPFNSGGTIRSIEFCVSGIEFTNTSDASISLNPMPSDFVGFKGTLIENTAIDLVRIPHPDTDEFFDLMTMTLDSNPRVCGDIPAIRITYSSGTTLELNSGQLQFASNARYIDFSADKLSRLFLDVDAVTDRLGVAGNETEVETSLRTRGLFSATYEEVTPPPVGSD